MPKLPTLTEELSQFLYTHAPQMHYKKQLMEIVSTWELAYLQRVAELESQVNAKSSRMIDEGGPDYGSHKYNDNRGNRFED